MGNRILMTLTGPSCSGKTFLLRRLLRDYPDVFVSLKSDTTRQPRSPNEQELLEYDFVTLDQFLETKAEGGYAQTVNFYGTRYGTRLDHLITALDAGKCPIRIVEPTGVYQFQRIIDGIDKAELVSVFIYEELTTLMERWLLRFHEDTVDKSAFFAQRVVQTFHEHQDWPNDTDIPYDIFYNATKSAIDELVHLLSRVARGHINMSTLRRIMPKDEESY